MQDEAYQREYEEALAKLEAGASTEEITQTRNPDGTFAKAEEPEQKAEPVAEAKPEPVAEPEAKPEVKQEAKPEPDPLEELRIKLEKAEKALKDTQAWGTKNAQRLKELEAERLKQQYEEQKPAILQQAPELEEAIRYATRNPAQEQAEAQARQRAQWMQVVESVHPGVFSLPNEDELVQSLVAKAEQLGDAWFDPLVAIREITAEKLAQHERQAAKRMQAEMEKSAQKSAMSVPSPGASTVNAVPGDPLKEQADRYLKMSSADFEKERRKILGLN